MQAKQATLHSLLDNSRQYRIPIYQRTYSWTEKECRQLLNDILKTGRDDNIPNHFIGSIVYIEESLSQVTKQAPLIVIDGQQRLTTLFLLIESISRCLDSTDDVIVDFSSDDLRNEFLFNASKKGELRFKLILTQTDKETLLAITRHKEPPVNASARMLENFEVFNKIVRALDIDELSALCRGLYKLTIVDITLERDRDDPQLIFESLNSTGLELSQADLIRNYLLMGLELEQQSQLYNEYWRPMEISFGQKAYSQYFDGFIRHYLTLKTGDIPNIRRVYAAFKEYANDIRREKGVESLLEDIHTFAKYYCAMALGQEDNSMLDDAFADLRELKVDVAYPFLLRIYHDYSSSILSLDDTHKIVRLVESYVFRRSVCQIPTNSLNTTFRNFSKLVVDTDKYLESFKAQFLMFPSYRRFPDDDEFRDKIMERDLYNFGNRSYWLRRFENYGRKERVSVGEYTIEHIMPQNEDLSENWRKALGDGWSSIQKKWLHTLGNLTLTAYNTQYGDSSFAVKRDMVGGFRDSPLRLNKELKNFDTWDEKAIRARAELLAEKATEVWTYPVLSDEVLDHYRPKIASKKGSYTIDDHPHLTKAGITKTLFSEFREKVLNINPCVVEEFLKLYVAYKAETNFVDVIPQAKNLRLSLNMDFHELQDPKEIAKDITGIGRWGNGDVEIHLNSSEDIPYVMGLVNQAFEKQMGNGAN